MSRYIYHYCAQSQLEPGQTAYIDGIALLMTPVHSMEDYRKLKEIVAKDTLNPDRLTITSLSFFGREPVSESAL